MTGRPMEPMVARAAVAASAVSSGDTFALSVVVTFTHLGPQRAADEAPATLDRQISEAGAARLRLILTQAAAKWHGRPGGWPLDEDRALADVMLVALSTAGPLLVTATGPAPARRVNRRLVAALTDAVTDWDNAVEGTGVGGQRLRNAAFALLAGMALLDADRYGPPPPGDPS